MVLLIGVVGILTCDQRPKDLSAGAVVTMHFMRVLVSAREIL